MRPAILALALFAPASTFAVCTATGSFTNCYDSSGNSYSVQRFGNTTIVNGSNPYTGSTWNQTSNTIGNTTFINGQTNGRSWNQTVTPYGTFGTDSHGNAFNAPRY